ncbi:MAG TPA: exosortase-associated EpsI family protein [Gemmataceae bacterium]|nr:exosortase-associated EpsI family protein [Gemmataceae bacterium]
MTRIFTMLAASALLIACGVVHGYWTDRWRAPVETAAAAARMDALPMEVGDWIGAPVEVKNPQSGGVAGAIERRYVNRLNGETVNIFLVCGRAGPVSIHTPEACYAANGFVVGAKSKASVREQGGDFWSADATKTSAAEETKLRIFWSWNDGKGWTAPNDARWTFVANRRSAVLYKLYVLRDLGGPVQASKDEPCQAFLQAMLPQLDRTLFAPGS